MQIRHKAVAKLSSIGVREPNPFRAEARDHQAQHLIPLLKAAAVALEREDADLRQAFAGAARLRHSVNQGLAYWVYETSLVYEIFKAWLPLVEVYWEHGYPRPGRDAERSSTRKADLVVVDGDETSLVLEAKWWMSNRKRVLDYLDEDIRRLRAWRGKVRDRVLLGFWWSRADEWNRDLQAVRNYCETRASPRPVPIFATRFPTQVHGMEAAHFAVVAVSVPPLLKKRIGGHHSPPRAHASTNGVKNERASRALERP